MAGAGQRRGKKDDNGIGTAIDFVLANARLVLGVGGAAMLGIATLAVKRVSEGMREGERECHGQHRARLCQQGAGSGLGTMPALAPW